MNKEKVVENLKKAIEHLENGENLRADYLLAEVEIKKALAELAVRTK